MLTKKLFVGVSLATVTVLSFQSGANADTVNILADDAYYTFREAVSANSDFRLLVDKATTIGLSPQDTFSFLKFDSDDFSSLAGKNYQAILTLQQETSLASFLIPATDANPLNVSVYNLTAPFDDVNGNIPDIDYGVDGTNAIVTTAVGDNGIYSWDISSLVNTWIESPETNNGIALSGLFGNVDINGRNSYGIFYTVGATEGLAPTLALTPVPEPTSILGLLAFGFLGAGSVLKKRSAISSQQSAVSSLNARSKS
ncbi:MAG: DNRLRE domain-containing protein [Trichodesmium sp. MO_231.B1]|nr:DNRLRE domain-containing protein [Trichodesmium sp. MO_231.B1]